MSDGALLPPTQKIYAALAARSELRYELARDPVQLTAALGLDYILARSHYDILLNGMRTRVATPYPPSMPQPEDPERRKRTLSRFVRILWACVFSTIALAIAVTAIPALIWFLPLFICAVGVGVLVALFRMVRYGGGTVGLAILTAAVLGSVLTASTTAATMGLADYLIALHWGDDYPVHFR